MKIYISILLLFSTLLLSAQGAPQSISLEEAIDIALENNRAAKNAARDILAAEEQKWETIATGLPQINANIDYQNFLKQQVSLLPAAAFDPLGGIRQLDEYYDLSDQQIKDLPDAPDGFIPVTFGTKQSINANATLSQLIFDGSYIVGLQSAKVFLDISKNAKEKTDLEVREAVINAYGNVLLTEEGVEILERNRETLQKNLDETKKIFDNGLTEEESVEQLQITLSGIESTLNNTERLQYLAYQMLNISMGLPLNTDLTLTDNLETLTEENIDIQLLNSDTPVENTIDYRIAENDMVSKELLVKLEKSRALPTLSSFLNAGYSAFNNEFNFTSNDQKWFGSAVVGISLSIPIFSSLGRTSATKRAEINLEKAKDNLIEISQRLQFQINNAKSEYQYRIEDYRIRKNNLELAQRIETKNEIKFFEGIATSFELRQAQTQLYTAQNEYLDAMLAVINAKASLETLTSQITLN